MSVSEDDVRQHRPAPRELRRSARTAWPPSKVAAWMALQVGVVIALILAAWWFLGRPH